MRVSWESSPPGVMFAGQVKKCTREGKQFSTLPATKAGTPCRVFPMEEVPGGRSRMDYGGRRMVMADRGRVIKEVVMVRDEDTGEPTFQVRVQAEKMTERQRIEARSVYRQRVGFQTEDNEGEESEEGAPGQHQGAGTGKE